MPPLPVPRRVAPHRLQPAPKNLLFPKNPPLPQQAQQRFLQRLLRLRLLPARHRQQKMIKPVEIKPVKLPERLLLPRRQPPCQQRGSRARAAAGWRITPTSEISLS